ncbi:MAG: vWA domain-containing protein [Alkalilacustris sp.]
MSAVTAFPGRATGPAERLAGFMTHLRDNGLRVGPADTAAALAALTHIRAADPREARLALQAICCGSPEDTARFPDLFAAYWLNRARTRTRPAPKRAPPPAPGQRPARRPAPGPQATDAAGRPDTPEDGAGTASHGGSGRLIAARMSNLARTDLRALVTPEDIAAAHSAAERLARALRDRRSRRRTPARHGRVPDLRRTLRASLATGGEPFRLHHRTRPDRPVRLTAICDVSGSMAIYARVFLSFLRGLAGSGLRTDTYLFHTRLVRITDALADGDHLRAVARLSLLAEGFGGGTRIGGALAAFNRGYARRMVSGRSVVLILSDGYDTDPPDRLAAELARLKRRGCRIVWLNPLKGWTDYAPVAAGMAAALPHLDHFAAANTLAALAALEPVFRRL